MVNKFCISRFVTTISRVIWTKNFVCCFFLDLMVLQDFFVSTKLCLSFNGKFFAIFASLFRNCLLVS